MEKGPFAILRFAKYKGPEIGRIEAHNERTKEEYASNPDNLTHKRAKSTGGAAIRRSSRML